MSTLLVFPVNRRVLTYLSGKDNTLFYQGNKLKKISFVLMNPSGGKRQDEVSYLRGQKEAILKVNWDSEAPHVKEEFSSVNRFYRKRKYEEASLRLYFLLKKLVSDGSGLEINGHSLRQAFILLSQVCQRQGEHEKAIEYSSFASDLDPLHTTAHVTTAISHRCKGSLVPSVQYGEEAVSLSPESPVARETLARSWRAYGLPKIALENAEEALRLEPTKASPYITLANILIDIQDYRKAAKVLQMGLKRLQGYEFNELTRFILNDLSYLENAPLKTLAQEVA